MPGLHDEQVDDMAQLFGDGEEAQLVAHGVLTSLQAMVLHCVERGTSDLERSTEIITAFVAGAFVGVDEIGFHLHPTWPVPRLTRPAAAARVHQRCTERARCPSPRSSVARLCGRAACRS